MTNTALLTHLSPAHRNAAFYVLLLGALMPSLNLFVVTIALPAIRDGLGATQSQTGLIISAYASAFAVCLITGGRLGDLFGRRIIYLIGMAGFTWASFLCGVALDANWLVAGRILQGISASMMVPPVLAAVRTLFSAPEVPWALNIYGTGVGVAVAGGQLLGGVLVASNMMGLGWRSAFLFNLPLGVCAFTAAYYLVPEGGGRDKPRLDLGGVVLLSAALASFVVPLSLGREQHWASSLLAWLASSPVLLAAFFWFERWLTRRGGMPILDTALLRVESFRRGLLVAFLFFFTTPFYLFFSLYLQAGQGESPLAAGLAVLPYGVANFIGPMMAARAPSSWRRYLFGAGMALEVLGYIWVALCAASATGGTILFLGLFVGGFGQGVAIPEMVSAVLGEVPHEHTGLAAGIMNSTLQIGAAISVASIGSLFFVVLGDGRAASDYGHALGVAMAAQVVALSGSMLLGLRRKPG